MLLRGADCSLHGHRSRARSTRSLCQVGCSAAPSAAPDAGLGPSTSGSTHTCLQPALPVNRKNMHDPSGRLMLKNLTLPELEQWCHSIGENGTARAMQLWRWMYSDAGGWIQSLDATLNVQNGFSQRFIDKAEALSSLSGGLSLKEVAKSQDGTCKLVFQLTCGDGVGGSVETVLIPVIREQGTKPRITVCISSQVGCAMNCQFCYTGRMGLLGQLSAAQIVEQVVEAKRFLAREGNPTPISNIVFMGMGEPLHNLEAVLAASSIMCDHMGLQLSHNKVTVSTVGLIPEIREFVERSRVQLALSLHATTDEVRDWIVPVNRRLGLSALMAVMHEHFALDNTGSRKVLIEYVLLQGVNDTDDDARRLVVLTDGLACKVNLITFNAHAGTRFLPSTMERALEFRSILIQANMVCTIRSSRGDDEMAACGQLGNLGQSSRLAPILEPPPRFRDMMQAQSA